MTLAGGSGPRYLRQVPFAARHRPTFSTRRSRVRKLASLMQVTEETVKAAINSPVSEPECASLGPFILARGQQAENAESRAPPE